MPHIDFKNNLAGIRGAVAYRYVDGLACLTLTEPAAYEKMWKRMANGYVPPSQEEK